MTDDKPNYINNEIKKVPKEELLKILHELHEKHKADRRQQLIDTNEALRLGFRCIPKV